MSEAKLKQKITGQLNALLMPRALDLLDYRFCHYDRSADPARPEYNEHVIYAFWHEYIVVVLPRFGHTPITVLCSQHRDGEWVNQTALSLGLHIVRGSTSRGGSSAIRQLKKNSKFSSIAITPDGPRGPRREMAMGPIYLSSLLGMPIVPLALGISNPHRLNTWDKFAVPRPLSRVRMIFGPKIYVPRKAKREKLESCRRGVQDFLNELTEESQHWADSKQKMKGEQLFLRCRRSNKLIFPKQPKPKLKLHTDDQIELSEPIRRVG